MKTKQETLETAIQKAIDREWDYREIAFLKYIDSNDLHWVRGLTPEMTYYIIFNHDFAKSMWGDELRTIGSHYDGSPITEPITLDKQPEWQYRLQQMVIADDPIEYLGANI